MRLGVPDVDDEQHRRPLCSARRWPRRPKLYVLPGSHPCAAVEAALRAEGRSTTSRVDLLPLEPAAGRPAALRRHDGARHAHRRRAARRLAHDHAPARRARARARRCCRRAGDPAHARVLEAERWGDEVLQSVPRRLIDAAFLRRPRAMESYAGDAKLPLPRALLRPALPLTRAPDGDQEQGARRDRARRPRGAARPARPHRRLDRRRRCSAASGPTPPTCRSAARSACC